MSLNKSTIIIQSIRIVNPLKNVAKYPFQEKKSRQLEIVAKYPFQEKKSRLAGRYFVIIASTPARILLLIGNPLWVSARTFSNFQSGGGYLSGLQGALGIVKPASAKNTG